MKGLRVTALIASICLVACSEQSKPSISKRTPTFVISNLSTTYNEGNYRWDYKRTGVLSTKDPALQKGKYWVLLEYKETTQPKASPQEWLFTFEFISDGVGSVSVSPDWSKADFKEKPNPPKYEWRIKGYVPLEPADLQVNN